jgi:GT2 family glycosyltransferase
MGNVRMIHPKINFDEIEGTRVSASEIWQVCVFKTDAVTDSEFARCLGDLKQYISSNPNVQISAGTEIAKREQNKSIGILLKEAVRFDASYIPNLISIFSKSDTSLLYSDYRIESKTSLIDIQLPAWSPIRFESIDYLGRVLAFDMGGLNFSDHDTVTSNELVRRALDKQLRISRLPRFSYTAMGFESDLNHSIFENNHANSISVVIPTKGLSDQTSSLLERCISKLSRQSWSKELELIVVVDIGYEKSVLDRVKKLCPPAWRFKLVEFNEDFNFSRKCNVGARAASGEVLIFLNDDVEIISEDAMLKLADLSLRDGVGAVGSQLKFPDGSIQHGGITLQDVKPRNSYLDQFPHSTFTGDLEVSHEVSAVTGACLAISKSNFDVCGGWNEELHNSYNDVDLCLRLNDMGLQTVIRNDLDVLHHESVSRDAGFDEESFAKLKSLWPADLGNEPYLRSPEALGIGYQGTWGINKDSRVELSGKYFQYLLHSLKTRGIIRTIDAFSRRISGKTSNLLRSEFKSYL